MGEWPIIPKSFSYYKTTEAQAREVDEMPDKDEIDLIINLDHLPFPGQPEKRAQREQQE